MPRNPDNRWIEEALGRLARRQHAVAARRQLLEIGLTASGVDERLARGRLTPVHKGVYALSHQPLTREGRWLAAVLACGRRAVLSHADAAAHFGLIPFEAGPVQVTVPSGSGRRSRAGIVVHRCDLPASDTTSRDAIPVTIVARTLLDTAPSLSRRSLERAIDEAVYLKKASERTLRGAVERNARRPGARAMRAVLARHDPGTTRTESELEEMMFALCRDHDLPQPICQQEILGYRVDFYWPSHRLIVETDGWSSHGDRKSFEADRERDMRLRAAGYPPPLRITQRLLTGSPQAVARTLRSELG